MAQFKEFSDQIIKHKELLYLQELREVRNCKQSPSFA